MISTNTMTSKNTVILYTSLTVFTCLLLYAIYTMYNDNKLVLPFILSVLSGLSTCIGALIVINTTIPIIDIHLAYTCGLACGVMLYISIFDMLLPALYSDITNNNINILLFVTGSVCLYGIVRLLPDNDLVDLIQHDKTQKHSTDTDINIKRINVHSMDDTDTDLESNTLVDITRDTSTLSPRNKTPTPRSLSTPTLHTTNDTISQHNTRTLRFGLITAIVLAIHNLPEGLSVFISALDNKQAGLLMTFAISLHNIAEGLVVAVPIYATTNNTLQTLWWTSLSGITEPIGALLSITLFHQYLTHMIVQYALVYVAGIMFAVCILELLPEGLRYKQHEYFVGGIVSGSCIMAVAIYLAEL